MKKKDKIVVGISLGDINGVGIEVVLKTFEDKRMLEFCRPILFGSSKIISLHKKILNIETNVHEINSIQQIKESEINLLNSWKEDVKVTVINFGDLCFNKFSTLSKVSLSNSSTASTPGLITIILSC